MALKIYDTLVPQGNYPAVNAANVEMPDGTTLDEFKGAEDAVLYTAQTLTEAQKLQARQNIDAASATDMENEVDRLDRRISELETAGGTITVDSELSATSTNPVQNKVITQLFTEAQTSIGQIVAMIPTEAAINALIDAKLGVIENGTY